MKGKIGSPARQVGELHSGHRWVETVPLQQVIDKGSLRRTKIIRNSGAPPGFVEQMQKNRVCALGLQLGALCGIKQPWNLERRDGVCRFHRLPQFCETVL